MKSHITDTELRELTVIHNRWNQMRVDQDSCFRRVCDLLDCKADESIDLLNAHATMLEVIDAKGIEVHREEYCQTPIEPMRRPRVDGETLSAWGLIVLGWSTAAVAAGMSF